MKLWFLSGIVLIAFFGCKNVPHKGKTVICGSIENAAEQFLFFQNSEFSDTVFLDSKKVFYKSFQLNVPSYISLKYGKEIVMVYAKPGDSIFFAAKEGNYAESLQFTGSCVAENQYLLEKKKHETQLAQTSFISTQQEESIYLKKVDSAYQSTLNFADQLIQKYKIDNSEFVKTEKAKILYQWADNLVTYEAAYSNAKSEKKAYDSFAKKYLSQVNFNDSLMIDFFEYRVFFESYLNMKASLLTKDFEASGDMDFFTNKMNVLCQTVTDKKVKSRLLYENFKEHIHIFGISGLKGLYARFQKECTTPKYAEEIDKLFKHWNSIEPGNIAPDFQLTDLQNNIHSLSEFRGKFVYIDVWATWCAPCRREHPFMQKLYLEYKKKDVVFISISIDDSIDAWKKMLEKEKPEWLQLHMEKGKSNLLDAYLISTIPRFILIDKEGKIINAQAPAASGDIRKLLNNTKSAS